MLIISGLRELETIRDALEKIFISNPDVYGVLVKVEKAITQEIEINHLVDDLKRDGVWDDLLRATRADILEELDRR